MEGKKVVITGGAGFIGSHLAERLVNQGNEVVIIDTLLRGNKIPNPYLIRLVSTRLMWQVEMR